MDDDAIIRERAERLAEFLRVIGYRAIFDSRCHDEVREQFSEFEDIHEVYRKLIPE